MATRGRPPKQTKTAAAVQQVVARYDAAGNGRRAAGWQPPNSGPRRAVQGTAKMRDRSRDATRNDWTGESAGQKWGATLIGVGITPRWDRLTNAERKQFVTDLWQDFVRTADADGVLDFYGLQTLAVRSWFESGEVFLRLRYRRKDSALPVPFQVQLMEADYVPLDFNTDSWTGLPKGNRICQGIELNTYGQRVAYWMFKDHPGETFATARTPAAGAMVRVPADQVRHLFVPKRPGQLRGVSELSSVLMRLRNAGDFEDAVLTRQQLANLWTVFITKALPPEAADIDYDSDTGLPKWYDKEGNPVVKLQAGMSQELAPGEDVKFPNPPEAGTTYSDYLRTVHMGTAAAGGLPYELFSGDLKDVSDRTLRVIMLEFRRLARQRQWQNIIPMICQPVMDGFADTLLLTGQINVAEYDAVRRVKWSPEGFEHIHPVQDPQGKIMEMDAGLVSRDELIAERGDDPAEVDASRKAAQERAKELKIDPPAPKPGAPGQQKQDDPEQESETVKALRAKLAAEREAKHRAEADAAAERDRRIQAEAELDASKRREEVLQARDIELSQDNDSLRDELTKRNAENIELRARIEAFETERPELIERAHAAEIQAAVTKAQLAVCEQLVETVRAEIQAYRSDRDQQNQFFLTLAGQMVASMGGRPVEVPVVVNQAPVEVTANVNLPDREIVTENVEHDKDGRIISVRQVEKTIIQ